MLDALRDQSPSAEALIEFVTLVEASDNPQLQAKLADVLEAYLETARSAVLAGLAELVTVVQESGNLAAQEQLAKVATSALTGEAGAAISGFAAFVQASDDSTLEDAVAGLFQNILNAGETPERVGELFDEVSALVEASGDKQTQDAFDKVNEPAPEFVEEIRAKVKALGGPFLESLFDVEYESGRAELHAYFHGLEDELRRR